MLKTILIKNRGMSPITLIFIAASLLITGCASNMGSLNRVTQLSESGNCKDALATIESMSADTGDKYAITGYVYGKCYKNEERGWYYVNLGARYGSDVAVKFLAENGKPIPPPDLAGSAKRPVSVGEAIAEGLANGVKEYSSRPQTTPTTTNCRQILDGYVQCNSY